MTADQWDSWTRSWRGPLFAALIAFVAGLPGVFALPPLDRDESRFAQATTQMFEQDDYINISFQAEPRHKKPVGIHWMQALSVQMASEPEAREIWAYRLPSLLGAMLAAAACAWGASIFFGSGLGFAAGAILGASVLLSTEASIAKTDAVLCGLITLMMAALGRLYAAGREAPVDRPSRRESRVTVALFWAGFSLSVLVKGPIGPMVAGFALLTLWAWDRNLRWTHGIGWWWGLVTLLAVVGPWALAITIVTDGAFWATSLGGDLAPKLAGAHESHGAPPGYHSLFVILMLFPATLLLPAALVMAWRKRAEPGVRFAIAWVLPSWLLFELLPTKLVHYPLPLYGGLAWLLAASLAAPKSSWTRAAGAALSVFAGVAFAGLAVYAVSQHGDGADSTWAALVAGLSVAAGLAGAIALLERASRAALVIAGALGVCAHGVLVAGLAPRLEPLWLSTRTARALQAAGLNPRDGVAPGPVAVAGFSEPSLVFALGTTTRLVDGASAARAIAEGRPAVVEQRELAAFRAEAARLDVRPQAVASVPGLNYSKGDDVMLILFKAESSAP